MSTTNMFKTGYQRDSQGLVQIDSPRVEMVYNGEILQFSVSHLLSRDSQRNYFDSKQYLLINEYLDYKGEEFKARLFNLCKYASEEIETLPRILGENYNANMTPPYELFIPILEMFDMEDIYNWIKNFIQVSYFSKNVSSPNDKSIKHILNDFPHKSKEPANFCL